MFGFLPQPCLRCCSHTSALTGMREAALLYRSTFCGLSKTLSGRFGLASSLLTNRDSTFLTLLGQAQSCEDPAQPTMSTCCNPLAPLRPIAQPCQHSEFAAAVSICALRTKLADDAADERGRLRGGLGLVGSAAMAAAGVDRVARERLAGVGFAEQVISYFLVFLAHYVRNTGLLSRDVTHLSRKYQPCRSCRHS
eukprot:SAG31_NODE_1128_length_9755_cov_4.535004_1_plen_195_part_00